MLLLCSPIGKLPVYRNIYILTFKIDNVMKEYTHLYVMNMIIGKTMKGTCNWRWSPGQPHIGDHPNKSPLGGHQCEVVLSLVSPINHCISLLPVLYF